MKKSELVSWVKVNLDLTADGAEKVLNTVLSGIVAGVQRDGEVKLKGFGTFRLGKTAARTVLIPTSKEPVELKARKFVKFRASRMISL